jgi:uncharacterized protein YegP (UPF0339 family)
MSDVSEITFVVQGPILSRKEVIENIDSIKRNYPEAKIILSTWNGTDVSDIQVDKVVFNEDPGAEYYYYNDKKLLNNCNRQIVSTLNGLKNVDTKYSVKLRTDINICSKSLLEYIGEIENSVGELFCKKIIAVSNLTVNPRRNYPMAFHVSDFFFFGLNTDLIKLFDIPLLSNIEANWFEHSNFLNLRSRYANEQYLLVSSIYKSLKKRPIQHAFDLSDEVLYAHDQMLTKNFLLLTNQDLGFDSTKYKLTWFGNYDHVYTLKEFKNIDKGLIYRSIPDTERLRYSLIFYVKKLIYKHSPSLHEILKKYAKN